MKKLLCFLLVMTLPAWVFALDIIHLNSGKILRGTITDESDDAITLETETAFEDIPRADVSRIKRGVVKRKAAPRTYPGQEYQQQEYQPQEYQPQEYQSDQGYQQQGYDGTQPKKVRFGITGGMVMSNMITPDGAVGAKTGPTGGAFVDISPKGPGKSVRIGLVATSKGAVRPETSANDPYGNSYVRPERTYTLTYLEIPLTYRLVLGKKPTGFGAEIGLGFSFLMSATFEDEGSDSRDVMDYYNSTDMGMVGSLFYQWNSLELGLGYNTGLMNIKATGDKKTNTALYATLGYKF